VTLKVVPKAACDSEIVPKADLVCREKNQPMRDKERQNRNLMWLLDNPTIRSVLKEASRIFIFIFLFNKAD
jgi:hypothetical protein